MDNISDNEKTVREERDQGSDSSHSSESDHESSGEAVVQVHSPVQVHASADEERSSPDYMETRDREERSRSSSSSSSDDEKEKAEEEAEATPAVEPLEEVNGEAHDGSRRSSSSSSSSSASSASPADPCDDPPNPPRVDDGVDGLLLAFKQQESVQHNAVALEKVTLDAPADPSQPLITLFVKVRHVQRSAPHEQTAFCWEKQELLLTFCYLRTYLKSSLFTLHTYTRLNNRITQDEVKYAASRKHQAFTFMA